MLTIFDSVPTGEKDAMNNEKMAAGAERARVAFNKGKLVFASLSKQDNGLVAVLNKAGKLTDEQARVLRERAKNTSDKALAMRRAVVVDTESTGLGGKLLQGFGEERVQLNGFAGRSRLLSAFGKGFKIVEKVAIGKIA